MSADSFRSQPHTFTKHNSKDHCSFTTFKGHLRHSQVVVYGTILFIYSYIFVERCLSFFSFLGIEPLVQNTLDQLVQRYKDFEDLCQHS